jgi:predicted aspartyl protease
LGHVYVNIKLSHVVRPGETIKIIDALVDTGATFTSIPRSVANDLGLPVFHCQQAVEKV